MTLSDIKNLIDWFIHLKIKIYSEKLKFPDECINACDKTEYCYRSQEILQIEHNIIGKWFREGISLSEYNNLSEITKTFFPYKLKLTGDDWQTFLNSIFQPMSDKITTDILNNRALLKKSPHYNLNSIDNI
ncbi:hypothetical protein ES702_04959 [subsurface metagenome]